MAEAAARHPDVLIPFASLDPARGRAAVLEARRLVQEVGMRGFKFHPSIQAFHPNDPMVYPLYEAIQELGVPALFHSGQTGIGAGMPGGGGIRLKYSNPLALDDVAADFPDLTIIIAHPSFPWQDEALAVATHKPNVYIDLSGWSPKYFPPQLVRYANTLLKHKVLFGSDFPLISPGPLAGRLRRPGDQGRGPSDDPQGQRDPRPAAGLSRRGATPPHPTRGEAPMTTTVPTPKDLLGLVGTTLGPGAWLAVPQTDIDLFARATHDEQWIHTDPVRAKDGPFGGTIAHGYLTLSLLIPLWSQLLVIETLSMAVNYGLNKVRFPAPVPAGASIRMEAVVASVEPVGPDGVQASIDAVVHCDAGPKPVCVAQMVHRY